MTKVTKRLTSTGVIVYTKPEYKTINIPADLHQQVKQYAKAKGMTISEVAKVAIFCYVNQQPAPDRIIDVVSWEPQL